MLEKDYCASEIIHSQKENTLEYFMQTEVNRGDQELDMINIYKDTYDLELPEDYLEQLIES